jgi:serine/threonine protein kinase
VDSPIRGQYQLLEKLGSGGMGEVYKARDLKLNRHVALKILRADRLETEEYRRRFLLEAQAASALNHPNIVTIHDIVTEGDADCIVMELIDGQPLHALIPADGLPVPTVIAYAAQIAEALAAAHAAGIVHRDLKPGNIMVTSRGLIKLLDFGLAKLLPTEFSTDGATADVSPLTSRGAIVGTLCYMSPEQALGKSADHRSDIFSFGALLYEMATGRRAFTGENGISTLSSVLRDEPRRVLEILPGLSPVLADLIHRCLRKDPDARPQSMAAVRDELLGLPTSAAVAPLPPTEIVAPAAAPHRSRLPWVAAALLLLLAAGYWLRRQPTVPPSAPPPPVEVAATPKLPPAAPIQPPAPEPLPIAIPDGTPVPLTLLTEIPSKTEAGIPLEFQVSRDVMVGGRRVIAKGATASGAVVSRQRKKQLLIIGRGTKIIVAINAVTAVSGSRLHLRATAAPESESAVAIESKGSKPKDVAVARGALTTAFTSGRQTVSLAP